MLENKGVALTAIRWSEIFPWLSIARGLRLAVGLRMLVFGAAAALLTLVGYWLIGRAFGLEGQPNGSWSDSFADRSVWQVIDASAPSRPFQGEADRIPLLRDLEKPGSGYAPGLGVGRDGPMVSTWKFLTAPILRLVSPWHSGAMTARDFFALVFSGLWSLAVWAYFGGAISRAAAVQLAVGEQVGWGVSLRWAGRKWVSYAVAPIMPLLGVCLAALPILVLGMLMKIDFFAAVAGLIWPIVLVGASIITLLVIGVLIGWPLMWATISVEGTDSFDALSRTYAYVFQKPARYAAYVILAMLIGWVGWFVVGNFAAAVIWFASWSAGWGAGPERIAELVEAGGQSTLSHAGSSLIWFWSGAVKLLAIGYSFSYFAIASTAIYYQLRRDADARETDEVFLDADIKEAAFGLPKLHQDAAGAPELAANVPPSATAADASPVNDTAD